MKTLTAAILVAISFFIAGWAFAQPPDAAELPKAIADLIDEGKTEEAKRALRDFRREHPDNAYAIYRLALLEDDRNLAMALLKEAERFGTKDIARDAANARAEMLFADGALSEAETIFAPIAADPVYSAAKIDALYRLGMIRLSRGDPDNALIQFRKCRDIATDQYKKTLARAGVMECHVARSDWNRVLVAAREVLEGRDDTGSLTPRVLEVLALAWRELGNEENAEKFTRRILTDFPRSYQASILRSGPVDSDESPDYQPGGGRSLSDSASSKAHITQGTAQAGSDTNRAADGDSILNRTVEYSVQVGAYEQRPNALNLYNRLKDAGFPVRIEMKTVDDKHRYLVRIGMYPGRSEAERMADRITRETGIRGNVVIIR